MTNITNEFSTSSENYYPITYYEKDEAPEILIKKKQVYPVVKNLSLPVKCTKLKQSYNRRMMKIKSIPKRNIKRSHI